MRTTLRLFFLLMACLWASMGFAASSDTYENSTITARLISVENGVAETSRTLSLGLDVELAEGWKAYWRSPGEVGLPPEISWDGSENLVSAQMLWPAPERFTAFGIENFGYKTRVVLPIQAVLETAGQSATLQARVSLLACSTVCVPHDFDLALTIPAGTGIDAKAAGLISEYAQRVPLGPEESDIIVETAVIADDALYVTARSANAFVKPDIFPELGPEFTFGKPDIRTDDAGTALWAKLPLLAQGEDPPPLQLTLTDGSRAVTAQPAWSDRIPGAPFEVMANLPDLTQILAIAAFAFLGGLILNVMPCVLPVLSIKLTSVLNHGNKPAHEVRNGFLMSALGVLVFMWALAAIILVLQSVGVTVGWGLQFQSPVFLTVMFLVLAVFSANLFGVFEVSLPSGLQSRLARSSGRDGYGGDFATGAFAAVLATPCSAPFLGTAVAFALSGRPIDVILVFTALGLGLSLPYLVLAGKPGLVRLLPRPGRWMVVVKWVLAGLLAGTAIWLLWVLIGVAGGRVAMTVLLMTSLFILLATIRLPGRLTRPTALVVVAVLSLLVPTALTIPPQTRAVGQDWVAFNRSEIPKLVSQGKTVFVDVTADWCLTCKANKTLVLDRAPVVDQLRGDNVVAMQADWTRPSTDISRYLESHNRFGIPFNIVYGPNAPDGIILSEVLTSEAVLDALSRAALGDPVTALKTDG